MFEESKLVSGDSEVIRKFSDKYIVPEKLVAKYAGHLAQIKMCKEKKKEETEREQMERLNREYNVEKVAMIKAHIGKLYDSMECQQPRQLPLRNVLLEVISSLSEVETDSQSDVVD